MFGLFSWVLMIHIGQLLGSEREAAELLDFGAGIFALILFTLSIYAWSRRKQPALLIVSLAFLLFFIRHAAGIIGEVNESSPILQLALLFMDFIVLILFFIAVVIRPKRKLQEPKPNLSGPRETT